MVRKKKDKFLGSIPFMFNYFLETADPFAAVGGAGGLEWLKNIDCSLLFQQGAETDAQVDADSYLMNLNFLLKFFCENLAGPTAAPPTSTPSFLI